MVYALGVLVVAVLCGVCWRMGGAGKSGQWYEDALDTKWRDIGSALCMLALFVGNVSWMALGIVAAMLVWGCTSYFNWLNPIVARFADIEVRTKYWWNFFAENLMIQSTALFVSFGFVSVVLAVAFAAVSALGKILIDADENGIYTIFGFEVNEDIASEWWHGFSNCILLAINIAI